MFLNQSLVNEPMESVVPLGKASIQKKCNFASSFVSLLLEKRPVKILASFLVDSIAGEHLAFLALRIYKLGKSYRRRHASRSDRRANDLRALRYVCMSEPER